MFFARDGPYVIAHILFISWFGAKSYAFVPIAKENQENPKDFLGPWESSLFLVSLSFILIGEITQFLTIPFVNHCLIIFNFIYKIPLIIIEASHFIRGITVEAELNAYTWDVHCIGLLVVGMHMALDAQFSVVQMARLDAEERQKLWIKKYQASQYK